MNEFPDISNLITDLKEKFEKSQNQWEEIDKLVGLLKDKQDPTTKLLILLVKQLRPLGKI